MKMVRQCTHRFLRSSLVVLLLLVGSFVPKQSLQAHASPTAGDDNVDCQQALSAITLTPNLSALLQQLNQPGNSVAERIAQAQQVQQQSLNYAGDAPQAAEAIRTQAVLVEASLRLKRGEYDSARQLLRRIHIDNPRAVTAGLLFAESWRLEGNLEQAQKWFLRLSNAFPHSLESQRGLITAALDASQNQQHALAITLLQNANRMALKSHEQSLPLTNAIDSQGIAVLFENPSDVPKPIHALFVREVITVPEVDVLAMQKRLRGHQQHDRCLAAHLANLQNISDKLTLSGAEPAQLLTSAQANLDALTQLANEKKSALESGVLTPAQIKLRQEITALNNQIQRQQAQLDFLNLHLAEVQRMLATAKSEFGAALTANQQQRGKSQQTVLDTLRNSAQRIQHRYADLAAEALVEIAEVKLKQP